MKSGLSFGQPRKGFAVTTIAIIGFIIVIAFLFASFFGGGVHSDTLLGWGEIPLLSGIDGFVTGLYNIFIYFSLWVSIIVLGIFLIGIQAALIFFYYKVFSYIWQFKDSIRNIIDELLDI